MALINAPVEKHKKHSKKKFVRPSQKKSVKNGRAQPQPKPKPKAKVANNKPLVEEAQADYLEEFDDLNASDDFDELEMEEDEVFEETDGH